MLGRSTANHESDRRQHTSQRVAHPVIGSYGDTLGDADVVKLLQDYNAGRTLIYHRAEDA